MYGMGPEPPDVGEISSSSSEYRYITPSEDQHITSSSEDRYITPSEDQHITSSSEDRYITPSEDQHITSSSEDQYYTASSGTPCSSNSVGNLIINYNKAKRNVSESEESYNSDSTTTSTLISKEDETQIFELDNICDENLLLVSEHEYSKCDEHDMRETVVSVPCGDPTTLPVKIESDSVEKVISFPSENVFRQIWKSRDVSFISESIFDRFRNETIMENEEEIFKIFQEKLNRSEDAWLFRTFGIEIEKQLDISVLQEPTDELPNFVDEIEGAMGGKILERKNTCDTSDTLSEDEERIVPTSLHRLILPPTLKTIKRTTQILPLSEEVDVKPIQQYVLKILVNGKSGAGKTSIIQRFTQNLFRQHRLSNGTVDMYVKVMNWNETTLLQLNFWDIPGDREIDSMKYGDACGSIIVHDVIKSDTLKCIRRWKQFIDKNILLPNGQPIPCVLLANKIDLQEDDVETLLDINTYCESLKISAWFVTSAREGTNIERAFNYLIVQMLQNKTSYNNFHTAIHHIRKRRNILCDNCCVN